MPERQHADWGELLREAIEKPGRMLEAYTAFHNFSFGNALLALEQCTRRNLQPGPLNTYNGWLEWKRQVRKGEKGITLCMPMACKRNAQTEAARVNLWLRKISTLDSATVLATSVLLEFASCVPFFVSFK